MISLLFKQEIKCPTRCIWLRFACGPADATATPTSLASLKSRMVLPYSCQLTQAVLEKRPFNGCSSSVVHFELEKYAVISTFTPTSFIPQTLQISKNPIILKINVYRGGEG